MIDTVLVGGFSSVLAGKGTSSSPAGAGTTVAIATTLGFFYHVALEGWRGQTPGKWACGIAVVGADGGPCSVRAAFLRTAGRFLDFLPFGYLAGLIAITLTERNQRIGDLVAGTVVVAVDRTIGR